MVRKTILEGWALSEKENRWGIKKEDQLSCYNVFNLLFVKFIVCNL